MILLLFVFYASMLLICFKLCIAGSLPVEPANELLLICMHHFCTGYLFKFINCFTDFFAGDKASKETANW